MRANNFKDRSGQVFGSITILKYVRTNKDRKPIYLWRCICGVERETALKHLLSGQTKSCGCLNAKNHTIHGLSRSRVYKIWTNIKNRTTNPKSTQWRYYGGIGVKMCSEWFNSFEKFYKYMGEPPTKSHSIDRFPNNEGNYEPGNVRWATMKEQANNRRITRPA